MKHMDESSQQHVSVWRWWRFGFKVFLAFQLVVLIAALPIYLLAGVAARWDCEKHPVIVLLALVIALGWVPIAVGWLFWNARDWFQLRGAGNGDF